jgi:hypothetical protein
MAELLIFMRDYRIDAVTQANQKDTHRSLDDETSSIGYDNPARSASCC